MTEPIDNPQDAGDDRPIDDADAARSAEGGEVPAPVPADLTDGWPDEAGNEQLASLAHDVIQQRGHLSPQALGRVRTAMHHEMDLRRGGRVSAGGFGAGNSLPRWFHFGTLLLVLVFLLGIGFWSVIYLRQMNQRRNAVHPASTAPAPVRDTYTLHSSAAGAVRVPDIVPTLDPQAVSQEMACWRMLPVKPAQLAEFKTHIDELAAGNPRSEWLAVYRLYALLLARDDAASGNGTAHNGPAAPTAAGPAVLTASSVAQIAAAADAVQAPPQFPTVAADLRLFGTLRDQYLNDTAAALEVIGERSWVPLNGLADLDQRLTRAAEEPQVQGETARKLLACRDRLRQAYLAAARHYRQRAFALRLLGRDAEAAALESRAEQIPALASPQLLREAVDALDAPQAWEQILHPLLNGDLALLTPARPPAPATTATEQMTITAITRIVEGADLGYRGNVVVTLGDLHMHCDRLSVTTTPAGSQLSGRGTVSVSGLPGFPDPIAASVFTFDTATGLFTFTGDVRLSPTRTIPACTITRSGVLFTQPLAATKRAQ